MYVTKRDMKDIEALVKLLDAGFTAITEKGVAVKEAESTDDILIENLIAEMEEE